MIKVVLQDGIKDCGICSLLSIIRYYGGDVSKEYLREITNTTKDGVSFYMLIEAAKSLGFEAIGMNVTTFYSIYTKKFLRERRIPFEITIP